MGLVVYPWCGPETLRACLVGGVCRILALLVFALLVSTVRVWVGCQLGGGVQCTVLHNATGTWHMFWFCAEVLCYGCVCQMQVLT